MRYLWRLRQSSFFRSVVAIAVGTALAQVLNFLFLPLLARLYNPEAMGLWGLFNSFVVVASVFTTLRYEVAIVTAASDEEALALTWTTLVLSVLMGLLGGVALELLRRGNLLGYGALPTEVSLLGFAALTATAWGTILRYYAIRRGMFSTVGRFSAFQGIARPVTQIFLSAIGWKGLLYGEILGRLFGLSPLWNILPRPSSSLWRLDLLLKFRIFPLVQVPSVVLNTISFAALVPIFVILYGPAAGGALALSQRVVGLPISLVGLAVADVFYRRIAELLLVDPHMVRPLFLAISIRLSLLAFFLSLLLALGAPFIVAWLLGESWALAGKMMSLMAPWMGSQLVLSSVGRIVFLSRFQWVKLFYDVLSVLTLGILFLIRLPPEEALVLLTWLYVSLHFLYWLVIYWLTDRKNLPIMLNEHVGTDVTREE